MNMFPILVAFLSLGLGGILKGATGAGAPLVAVPALALLFDVPTAIAIFSLPNLLSNAWQGWSFRKSQKSRRLVWGFAGAGVFGMALGTYFLTILSPVILEKALALIVLAFVTFKPTMEISPPYWNKVGAICRILSWGIARCNRLVRSHLTFIFKFDAIKSRRVHSNDCRIFRINRITSNSSSDLL